MRVSRSKIKISSDNLISFDDFSANFSEIKISNSFQVRNKYTEFCAVLIFRNEKELALVSHSLQETMVCLMRGDVFCCIENVVVIDELVIGFIASN